MEATKIINVDPSKLILTQNTRCAVNLDIETLAHSIETSGVQVPIALRKIEGGFEVLQGNRRTLASRVVQKRSPKAFAALHPSGIPAYVRTDVVSDADAVRVKVDHGQQLSLTLKCELQTASNMLLDVGATEAEVIDTLEGLFDALGRRIPSETRAKIKELRAEKRPNEKKIRRLIHNTHRGTIQKLKKVWRLPPIVAAALEYAETGAMPEGYKDLPSWFKVKDTTDLLTAFDKDCEIRDDDGLPKFSRGTPGPAFKSAWKAIATAKPEKVTTIASLTRKKLLEEIEQGLWVSRGFKRLTQRHAGDTDVTGLQVYDRMLHAAETMKKYNPDAWKTFVAGAADALEKAAQ